MQNAFLKLAGECSRLGFFGLGRSNLSLIRMLPEGSRITLRSDGRVDLAKLPDGICADRIYEGAESLSDIAEDALILSPSVRRGRAELVSCAERGVRLTSDPELFFESANAPTLCVSGSSGKSTVATICSLLIGEGAVLCGNVGEPMVESLSESATVYVCELSSFMLAEHRARVQRSAITNITPNHLDWHSSFEEYRRAKLSLLSLSDEIVISADDPILSDFVGRGRRVFGVYSTSLSLPELLKRHKARVYMTLEDGYLCRNGEKILNTGRLIRSEEHNIANMMCAALLADGRYKPERLSSVLCGFSGLAHRCETVACSGGVKYIDSSIDTTPERCATTLLAISSGASPEPSVLLLLGGRGKGLSYEPLKGTLSDVRHIFAFGEEGKRINEELSSITPCTVFERMSDALYAAQRSAVRGDKVLLSPAATSFDEFSSFEERGRCFSELARSFEKK